MAKVWLWLAENIGLKGLIIIVVAGALASFAGYNYYKVNQAFKTVKSQTAEIKKLEWSLGKANEKIDAFTSQHESVKADLLKQMEQMRKAVEEKDQLLDELNREVKGKKSIEELAAKKPKLVQKAMTKGTKDVLSCIEAATGNKESKCVTH